MRSTRKAFILVNMRRTLIILSIFLPVSLALADGNPSEPSRCIGRCPPDIASEVTADKRLPPVIPGERVSDSGTDTRVWSTSGPVHVSKAPEPFKDQQMIDDFVLNKGVIVDDRGQKGPHAGNQPH